MKLEELTKEELLEYIKNLNELDIDMFEELYYDPEKELDSEGDYEL